MISERKGLLIKADGTSEFQDTRLLDAGVRENKLTYKSGIYREIDLERERLEYIGKSGNAD